MNRKMSCSVPGAYERREAAPVSTSLDFQALMIEGITINLKLLFAWSEGESPKWVGPGSLHKMYWDS